MASGCAASSLVSGNSVEGFTALKVHSKAVRILDLDLLMSSLLLVVRIETASFSALVTTSCASGHLMNLSALSGWCRDLLRATGDAPCWPYPLPFEIVGPSVLAVFIVGFSVVSSTTMSS